MQKRREGTDLYATILEVVKTYHGNARITRMSYGAGMPVDRLRPAIERLLQLGLLSERVEEDATFYEISVRGHEFLSAYWRLKGFIEPWTDRSGLPPEFAETRPRRRDAPSPAAGRGAAADARRLSRPTLDRDLPNSPAVDRTGPPGSPPRRTGPPVRDANDRSEDIVESPRSRGSKRGSS